MFANVRSDGAILTVKRADGGLSEVWIISLAAAGAAGEDCERRGEARMVRNASALLRPGERIIYRMKAAVGQRKRGEVIGDSSIDCPQLAAVFSGRSQNVKRDNSNCP